MRQGKPGLQLQFYSFDKLSANLHILMPSMNYVNICGLGRFSSFPNLEFLLKLNFAAKLLE